MKARTLDTYAAILGNEIPARQEQVTEIQDDDSGALICYANPDFAKLICEAVNGAENIKRELAAEIRSRNKFRDEATELRAQVAQCQHALLAVSRLDYLQEHNALANLVREAVKATDQN